MDVELEELKNSTDIKETREIGGNTYYHGTLNGADVVLVRSGMGKVLSASYCQALIDVFDVSCVIFTGVAGGVGNDVSVMDMVVATGLVQHDYGTITNNGFELNAENSPVTFDGIIPIDQKLSDAAYATAKELLGEDKVHRGIIATGDQFVSSEKQIAFLREEFNAIACEMEGAAVAKVCAQSNIPCTVLRCMSDKGDGVADDTYAFNYENASDMSASVVMKLLSVITEK